MILLIRLINMIPTDERDENAVELLKTSRDGRVRYSLEQKERVLDLFEQSGMSGRAFAEEHGKNMPGIV